MEQFYQIFTIVVTLILGLCIGSFLNVVIYRLPLGMSLAKPASHCPKCNEPIKWYDNIPLFSYIFLKGKCRHCKEKISIRYPLIELTNCILWFLCLMMFTNYIIPTNPMNWLKFIVSCFICSDLLCIFFVDFDRKEIPDVFIIILLLLGVLLLLEDISLNNILLKVFGFIGAGALFFIVNFVYKLIKKKDGIGFGDVELVSCMGLILGGYNVVFCLLVSCVVGSIVLIILYNINKQKEKEYPFAVILVPGFILGLFIGDIVISWYLNMMGVIL